MVMTWLRWEGFAVVGLLVCAWLAAQAGWAIAGRVFDRVRMMLFHSGSTSMKGKVAWVLGASSGIGEASALALAARGASVALTARRIEKLEAVAEACRAAGAASESVCVIPGDCGEPDDVRRMFSELKERWGLPDILVLVTGAGAWRYLHTQSPTDVLRGMQAPFFASALVLREVLPDLLAAESRAFQVLAVQSPVAYLNWPGCTMYSSNRAALRGFVNAARQDLHGSNVHVVPICLAETETGYWDAHPGSRQYVPWISRMIPTYTSEQAGAIVVRVAALGKRNPVFENIQIAFLVWLNKLAPRTIAWTNRWYRRPIPRTEDEQT